MATLTVLGPPLAGQQFTVTEQKQLVIGRDHTCDMMIDRRSVSRHHAQVSFRFNQFEIEDCDSANGTFLNGKRVQKRTPLKDQDRISIHDIPIVFSLSDHLPLNEDSTDCRFEDPLNSTHEFAEDFINPMTAHLKGRLDSLVEITRYLGKSFDTQKIFPTVLNLLFKMYPHSKVGEIHLLDEDQVLRPVAMKRGRDGDSEDLSQPLYNGDVLNDVIDTGLGIVLTESSGPRESATQEIESLLCVPIHDHDQNSIGVIFLETDDEESPFQNDDLPLTMAVAILTGQSIAYAEAHAVQLEHSKVESQLESARQIQLSTLPASRPLLHGYQFSEEYTPAQLVGGDYYFYHALSEHRILIGIADASGKGLPAAMRIMRFAGEAKLQFATASSLKRAMEHINSFVCAKTTSEFITCCVAVLDAKAHELSIVNAGHLPPLLKRAETGDIEVLSATRGSLPLGVIPDSEYHIDTFQLQPGDQVMFYTDGVSEAMNPNREIYGDAQILDLMGSTEAFSELLPTLVEDINRFRADAKQSDDLTIVALERVANSRPMPML